MENPSVTAVLLLSCPDRRGLVSEFSAFISQNGGNILSLNEHVGIEDNSFFLRVAWDMNHFKISEASFEKEFNPLAERFSANWNIFYTGRKTRAAIFVSKYDHCLRDILWRTSMSEFSMEVPVIISNYPDQKVVADRYGIPYFVFPVTKENKAEMELKEMALMREYDIDTIILARYMQVLSPSFVKEYPNRIINIHHSFLPAFAGSNPYRQAFDKGVKIIGATSHYVTQELDEGPIIDQDIARISHKDTVQDLIRKGRDLERLVLSRAVRFHTEHRILVHGKKTVVFD